MIALETPLVASASPRKCPTLSPFGVDQVTILDGPLARWQSVNAEATIPHCIAMLEESGVLDNFRRVVGESGKEFRGFWFADSDLYKVIEAVAWEIGRTGTKSFDAWLDDVISLVRRVQEPSGYVMTWIQGVAPEKKFAELDWTHEMYVLGHLIQAAVALDRACGRSDLLEVATDFADLVDRRFGPGREDGICGHPEVETALVELYRHTEDERYLRLAQKMIDLRGQGILKVGAMGPSYFQDHIPVRESRDARGHAVRQLYLNAGVTDLYLETGDADLLHAMESQWDSVHKRKMYISGAFGARHRDEAFGDDFELPSDRAYAETCATIADIFWNWRMMLAGGAQGSASYAESIEREIYNALAASIDETGTKFFYSNPLQLRADKLSEQSAPRDRTPWYECACCPPNIARTIAQMGGLMAAYDDTGVWLHQIAPLEVRLPGHLGSGVLRVRTDYPNGGNVSVEVDGSVGEGVELRLRVPSWAERTFTVPDGCVVEDGYLRVPLADDTRLEISLDVNPRFTMADSRVDAVRGCVAVEKGPLLYCIEDVDLDDGIDIDSLRVITNGLRSNADGTVDVPVEVVDFSEDLYETADFRSISTQRRCVPAIPFARWGNRGARSMRVWVPVAPRAS